MDTGLESYRTGDPPPPPAAPDAGPKDDLDEREGLAKPARPRNGRVEWPGTTSMSGAGPS